MTRNVVFIILDTVRKDYFDDYAGNLLTLSGASFENCVVGSSWSTPSHASILTGELPHRHKVHTRSQSFQNVALGETFLGSLESHRRVCVTDHKLLSSHYSFDKFFDEYYPAGMSTVLNSVADADGLRKYAKFLWKSLTVGDEYATHRILRDGLQTKFHEKLLPYPSLKLRDDGAAELTNVATRVAGDKVEPMFLFMNFLDAHSPYHVLRQFRSDLHSAPASWSDGSLDIWEMQDTTIVDYEYRENYRGLYAAAIEYLDRVVSEMIADIRRQTDRETTVVITADHGHNLGYPEENGLFGHESSMSEGVLHVPLEIINPPAGFPETIPGRFSHLQLGELLTRLARGDSAIDDLTGDPTPVEVIGHPSGESKRDVFPGSNSEWQYWDRMIRVVYDDDCKYEWDSCDNSAVHTLDSDNPNYQECEATRGTLPAFTTKLFDVPIDEYKKHVDSLNLDSDSKSHLRDLGYL